MFHWLKKLLLEHFFSLGITQTTNQNLVAEAVVQRCSVKKMFLEISQNSQENTCARVSFLIKLQTDTERSYILKNYSFQLLVYLRINPQSLNDANWRFSGLLQFQPFFGHFLLLSEKKKFNVKQANFLPSKCTSFLLRSKPVQ